MGKQGKAKKKIRGSELRGVEKQLCLEIDDQSLMRELVGEQDSNLKTIERELEVKIGRGSDGLLLRGMDTDVELAYDLLSQLKQLAEEGEYFANADIGRAIRMLSANRHARIKDLFHEQIKISGRKTHIVPKTPTQKVYLEAIRADDVVFGIGPAGTGKTYLAMGMAVSALLNKEVKRVVLCRPAVEAGEKLGFLPGDMAEKVNPYLRPLYDALHDMIDFDRAKEMVEKGQIEVAPLAFMRGRTLSNSFVILDEAQNTTPGQMKMFLTRVGLGSKCVVTGDITQVDLPGGASSGLVDAMNILKKVEGLSFVYFNEEDVIRHPLVGKIVAAYRAKGK